MERIKFHLTVKILIQLEINTVGRIMKLKKTVYFGYTMGQKKYLAENSEILIFAIYLVVKGNFFC